MFRVPVITDEEKIDELLSRGAVEALPSKESLKKLLSSGRRLRVKLGVDPTGEHLHLGHSVPLLKLRDFQELGHQVVLIIGDFTAVIGDTSDKESERPMLSRADIERNMRTWRQQVAKILDLRKAELRKNSEWLGRLTYREIGEHADTFSVSDFIARENIKRRLDNGKRVSLREVLYPLMQGYDSVAVRADIELGGTDQRFNLLAGRALQERYGQKPQHILTFALVTDASGKKLSKTDRNAIHLTDSADEMFGKTMAISDELVRQYFTSMTRKPLGEVERALAGHPRDAKLALAEEVVGMYHGESETRRAQKNFTKTFSEKDISEEMVRKTPFNEGQTYLDALAFAGAGSRAHIRRLITTQDALFSITRNKKITDANEQPHNGEVVRLGPRTFFKFILNK